MGQTLKVIFAGTPDFSVPSLQALIESPDVDVCAVYTQPDRRAGRGRQLMSSPVKQLAMAYQIPVFQPETLRDEAEQTMLAALNADLMIVVAYGLILPKAVLSATRLGAINVHASLLPRWRGASPIQHAILEGDLETGVSIMQIEPGLDSGPVLNTIKCTIGPHDTTETLFQRLSVLGAEALMIGIHAIENGRAHFHPQDSSQVLVAPKITKEMAVVDWTKPAQQIERQIRAFLPWPVASSILDEAVIKIYQAEVLSSAPSTNAQPGEIVALSKLGVDVQCGLGVLRLKQIQLPGLRVLPAVDLYNSRRDWFTQGKRFALEEGQSLA